MGIQGLLKVIRGITKETSIASYHGKTVGVDISCWLHKGSYSCSKELVEGIPTTKHVSFCMKMLRMLVSNGVTPVVVFDGLPLPAKKATNAARSESRAEHTYLARQSALLGQKDTALRHYQQAVTLTAEICYQLMVALTAEHVQYIVAPYEADAQLAFLSQQGYIDAVLTEDSDALAYGCSHVLFKLNANGVGEEIQLAHVFAPAGGDITNKSAASMNTVFGQETMITTTSTSGMLPTSDCDFTGWTLEQFQLFCCLAGCDYAPKLKNMGIKTAFRLVSKYKTLKMLLIALQQTYSTRDITPQFELQLHQAWLTFKHQTIFNPVTRRMEHLTPIPTHYSMNVSTNTAERYMHTGNTSTSTKEHQQKLQDCGFIHLQQQQPQQSQQPSVVFEFLGKWINHDDVPAKLARGELAPATLLPYTSSNNGTEVNKIITESGCDTYRYTATATINDSNSSSTGVGVGDTDSNLWGFDVVDSELREPHSTTDIGAPDNSAMRSIDRNNTEKAATLFAPHAQRGKITAAPMTSMQNHPFRSNKVTKRFETLTRRNKRKYGAYYVNTNSSTFSNVVSTMRCIPHLENCDDDTGSGTFLLHPDHHHYHHYHHHQQQCWWESTTKAQYNNDANGLDGTSSGEDEDTFFIHCKERLGSGSISAAESNNRIENTTVVRDNWYPPQHHVDASSCSSSNHGSVYNHRNEHCSGRGILQLSDCNVNMMHMHTYQYPTSCFDEISQPYHHDTDQPHTQTLVEPFDCHNHHFEDSQYQQPSKQSMCPSSDPLVSCAPSPIWKADDMHASYIRLAQLLP